MKKKENKISFFFFLVTKTIPISTIVLFMRQYDKTAIAAAFSTVARQVREGKPVVLGKVEGLNSTNQVWFKAAVTHNFNEKDHGFNLQKIFIVDEKNPNQWKRNTGAKDNPKDIELVDRIMRAMTLVARLRNDEKSQKLQMPKTEIVKVETPKKEMPKPVPFEMPEPVEPKLPILPGWEAVLKAYPGILSVPLFEPEKLNNDALEYAIQKTAYTLELLKIEKEKRSTKKAELLKTIKELLSEEGFTLEELLK